MRGMIEPNMATMLAFILTDADLSREDLSRALKESVEDSFNAISVDSDQSTSDMAILLSSRKVAPTGVSRFCQSPAAGMQRSGR